MKKDKPFPMLLYILAFFGVVFWYLFIVDMIRNEPPLNYDPHHAINGIDTVYTKDSIYTIEVKIINAEPQPEEEPQDYR